MRNGVVLLCIKLSRYNKFIQWRWEGERKIDRYIILMKYFLPLMLFVGRQQLLDFPHRVEQKDSNYSLYNPLPDRHIQLLYSSAVQLQIFQLQADPKAKQVFLDFQAVSCMDKMGYLCDHDLLPIPFLKAGESQRVFLMWIHPQKKINQITFPQMWRVLPSNISNYS